MQKLNLVQKLSVLAVLLLLTILVVVGVVGGRAIQQVSQSALDRNLRSQAALVEELIQAVQQEAMQVSAVLAELEQVKDAYRLEEDVAGRAELAAAVDPIARTLEGVTGIDDFRIHFHKPPAVSFYRTWTERAGDDLSGFRRSILEVRDTQEPLRTVELGRGGFVIRGISPVMDGQEYLGSVEVYYQPTRLVSFLDVGYRSGIVLLVDADAAEDLFFEEDYEDYFQGRVGDSLVSSVSADWIDPVEMIDPALVQEVRNSSETALATSSVYQKAYIPLQDFSGEINGQLVSVLDTGELRAEAQRRVAVLTGIVVGLLIVGAAILLLVAARLIAQPLNNAASNLAQIASGDGDLSLRMPEDRSDEIGRLSRHFNAFAESLAGIVSSVQDASGQLAENAAQLDGHVEETQSSAGSIQDAVKRVAGRIKEQESSINQSSASVEEITGNIGSLEQTISGLSGSIDDSASAVEQMSASISSITRNLEQVDAYVNKLVGSSEQGRETLGRVIQRINEMAEQSEQLQQANQLIANISAQTNLLAMNAAIEAAHAGEYGKGFAVVADEIRKLAENSSEQSKRISAELKKTGEYVDNAVAASREADEAFGSMREMVSTVNELETDVRQSLQEQESGSQSVRDNLETMRRIGSEVNGGMSEISTGSQQILEEITKLVDISREVTALAEEIASGTDMITDSMNTVSDMSRHNRELVDTVRNETGRFKV